MSEQTPARQVAVMRIGVTLLWLMCAICPSMKAGVVAAASPVAVFAIEHVNLIPMTSPTVLENRTVVIRDGRVTEICQSTKRCTPKGAQVIDGRGRYLMPALADMHNHIGGVTFDGKDSTRIRTRDQILRQYVMFGIAVVRDPAADLAVLAARDQINTGELFGPRLFVAWGVMDGDPPLFPGTRSFSSPTVAADFVRETAQRGFDFAKVYSTLSPQLFDTVLDTASQVGLSVAAHVPIEVPLAHALQKGLRSIEHLTGYDVACAAPSVKMRPVTQDIYQGWAWCTPQKIRELATLTAQYPVWNVPTLSLWDDTVTELHRETRNAGEVGIYEHPTTNLGIDRFYAILGPRERAGITGTRAVRLALVKALSDAGAPLMVGTDTSAAGYTVHRELAAFVEAGLTPYQALRAATVEPARYLRREGDFGVVAQGARADVLLLDANPLTDVGNARKIHGLMFHGRWWSKAEIDAELQALQREYAEDATALRSMGMLEGAGRGLRDKPPAQSPRPASPMPDTDTALQKYTELCSGCHGKQMQGGLGPSLIDDVWIYGGGDDDSVARSISAGAPDKGMPSWGASLSPAQVRSLVILIHEKRAEARNGARSIHDRDALERPLPQGVQHSQAHDFRVEPFVEGLDEMPYSFAFTSATRLLVTERRKARLRVVENGKLFPDPVEGTPGNHRNTAAFGALLSVAVHPDFDRNGWIYLSFGDDPTACLNAQPPSPSPSTCSLVAIVRGRIIGNRWTDQQMIWQAPDNLRVLTPDSEAFFAGLMTFDRRARLYFSIGVPDRIKEDAQDLSIPHGKIFRVLDDGGIPQDNPFVHDKRALPGIFSYGHRNPEGLALQPRTGNVWSTEHGPRGGDELNLIRAGRNYGWPKVTYGMNYDGTPIAEQATGAGFEPPVQHWTPSIAVSNLTFYEGRAFPHWRHNLFVASLKSEELLRLEMRGARVTRTEQILHDAGRIRDLQIGPDGYLYLLIESLGLESQSRIIRLVPAGRVTR